MANEPKAKAAPEPDPRDARIEALELKLDAALALIKQRPQSAVEQQTAKLITQEAENQAKLDAWAAEVGKGIPRLSQEAADRMFPHGSRKFRCVLKDGNGHPELVINADTDTDAKARYEKVCGIRGTSEKHTEVAAA